MRKVFSIAALVLSVFFISAQTLQDAQREIDNENYFHAKQILSKLFTDPNANKSEVAYSMGNAYLKSDDADSAVLFYKKVQNPDNKTALGHVALGRIALLAKNPTEATTNFTRATQLTKQKNASIYYEIGDAYFRPAVINLNAAILNFEAAYNLDNKNCTIMLALGDAYLENSATDNTMGGKAMNKYEAATDACKGNPMAHIKQGRLAVRGRIYDQAIQEFNKALEIDQKYPIVYKELAEAYYLSKQYDKVKPNYEKYIQLSPGDNQAKLSLIELYLRSKEYDKAVDEATKGLNNDPGNYVFLRVLSIGNYELKRYKEASEASAKFWANPNKKVKDIDYIYSARIAAQVGDTAAALNYFKVALATDSSCDLLGEYAKVLFQAKHYGDAVAQYGVKKAKCEKLNSVEVFYLGRCYYAMGDSLMADTTFAEFISRNAASPDGYLWRAMTNLKIGKPEDFNAYPYYLKYIEVAGGDPVKYKRNLPDAYSYVGIYCFEKLKDKEQAKTNFMKSLEIDPANSIATEYMKQYK